MKKIHQNSKKIKVFPYLKIIIRDNEQIVFKDKWGVNWTAKSSDYEKMPKIGTLVSFKGELNFAKEINNIHDLIIHNGYELKLYISIFAFIYLMYYLSKLFSINCYGIFRKID